MGALWLTELKLDAMNFYKPNLENHPIYFQVYQIRPRVFAMIQLASTDFDNLHSISVIIIWRKTTRNENNCWKDIFQTFGR